MDIIIILTVLKLGGSSINYQSQLSGIKSFLWQLLQPHTMYFPLKLLSFSIASIIIIIIIIIIEIIAIGIIFIHLHCMITPIKNDALSLIMIIIKSNPAPFFLLPVYFSIDLKAFDILSTFVLFLYIVNFDISWSFLLSPVFTLWCFVWELQVVKKLFRNSPYKCIVFLCSFCRSTFLILRESKLLTSGHELAPTRTN